MSTLKSDTGWGDMLRALGKGRIDENKFNGFVGFIDARADGQTTDGPGTNVEKRAFLAKLRELGEDCLIDDRDARELFVLLPKEVKLTSLKHEVGDDESWGAQLLKMAGEDAPEEPLIEFFKAVDGRIDAGKKPDGDLDEKAKAIEAVVALLEKWGVDNFLTEPEIQELFSLLPADCLPEETDDESSSNWSWASTFVGAIAGAVIVAILFSIFSQSNGPGTPPKADNAKIEKLQSEHQKEVDSLKEQLQKAQAKKPTSDADAALADLRGRYNALIEERKEDEAKHKALQNYCRALESFYEADTETKRKAAGVLVETTGKELDAVVEKYKNQ